MARSFLEAIATRVQARHNCKATGNEEWFNRHLEAIEALCKDYLPHGSGFDSGTQFNENKSRPDCLIFNTAFHHMNENGYYDGWTEHQVIVRPSFIGGFSLRITGQNRRQIKEYLIEVFNQAFSQTIKE